MEVIKSLVQNLIVIIMLALFLEMLIPAGEMRRYVKMVMGLLVIVAVIQAAGDLVRRDFSNDIPSLTVKENGVELSGIMEAGRKLSDAQKEKAVEQYRRGLAGQVMALARMNRDVPVVDAEVNVNIRPGEPGYGRLKEIVLTVAKDPDAAVPERKDGGIAAVEPVNVQVGPGPESPARAGENNVAPAETVAALQKTLANFYNITPEQVKVVYR